MSDLTVPVPPVLPAADEGGGVDPVRVAVWRRAEAVLASELAAGPPAWRPVVGSAASVASALSVARDVHGDAAWESVTQGPWWNESMRVAAAAAGCVDADDLRAWREQWVQLLVVMHPAARFALLVHVTEQSSGDRWLGVFWVGALLELHRPAG